MMPKPAEVEYVDECPSCGIPFIGMSPNEFRETHASEDCPKAPLTSLFVFPSSKEDTDELS